MLLHDYRRHLARDLVYLIFKFRDGRVVDVTIVPDQPVGPEVHGWTRDGAEITVLMEEVETVSLDMGVQSPILPTGSIDGGG